ncbi:MAG TPA: hypothetical protein VFN89_11230 [Solirubrobacterales bacterium]|nr:hypothetical protein [Solirubrobacterales bacterium]
MSESKVQILLFVGACVVGGIAGVVLALTHASGTAYGLTIFIGAALGGYVSSLVLMRHAELEKRRKREELILSR